MVISNDIAIIYITTFYFYYNLACFRFFLKHLPVLYYKFRLSMDKVNTRIFDRSNYSSTTISTFQIVGAYFVDVYYNHLYTEAIKFKTDGKAASKTEGYRHATFAFLSALDNKAKGYRPENYNKLLQGIYEYFVFWTNFTSLTVSECIDKMVREFVPADYFASLVKEQKRNILRQILIESIREFTKIVIGEFLGAIIDNHDETANVEALKEKMVDVFIMQRETMFHKFIDCRSGGKPDEKVDKRFLDKLRNEVMRLNDLTQSMAQENKQLTEKLAAVQLSAGEVVQRFKKLKMRYDAITQEYTIGKNKINALEDALRASRMGHSNTGRNTIPSRIAAYQDEEDDDEEDDVYEESSLFMPAMQPNSQPVSKPVPQPNPSASQNNSQPVSKPAMQSNTPAMQSNTPASKPAMQSNTPASKSAMQPSVAANTAAMQSNTPASKPAMQSNKPDRAGPLNNQPASKVMNTVMNKALVVRKSESDTESSESESESSETESSNSDKNELPTAEKMDSVISKHIMNAKAQLGKPPALSENLSDVF
jgi:hypothetical protein